MANTPQKSVSPVVAAIVIILAIVVIGLVGYFYLVPKPPAVPDYNKMKQEMQMKMKGGMKGGPAGVPGAPGAR